MSRARQGPCVRSLIDAHFAMRGSPAGTSAIGAHLDGCDSCRGYYERHLLFARLDPKAKPSKERVAAALGLRLRGHGRALAWPALASACAAAAIAVLALRTTPRGASEMVARGAPPPIQPSLEIFRVDPSEPIAPGGHIRRDDELAFAYANPTGFRHLLVFGVDERKHVYWYHPAWTDPAGDPRAVDVPRALAPTELPEAIRHSLEGRELVVHAIFLDDDLSVRGVEECVAKLASAADPLSLPNSFEQRIRLSVEP